MQTSVCMRSMCACACMPMTLNYENSHLFSKPARRMQARRTRSPISCSKPAAKMPAGTTLMTEASHNDASKHCYHSCPKPVAQMPAMRHARRTNDSECALVAPTDHPANSWMVERLMRFEDTNNCQAPAAPRCIALPLNSRR